MIIKEIYAFIMQRSIINPSFDMCYYKLMRKTGRNLFTAEKAKTLRGLLLVILLLSMQAAVLLHKTRHHHFLNQHCPVCLVINHNVVDVPAMAMAQMAVYFLLAITAVGIVSVVFPAPRFSVIRAPPIQH